MYKATRKRCRDCQQKAQCTRGHYRQIAIHVREAARQRARERARVPAFAAAQRQRRKVEALLAELKNQIGLRRVRLRRMKHVREVLSRGYSPELETTGSLSKIQISRISHGSDLR